jgi:hypothetical protein
VIEKASLTLKSGVSLRQLRSLQFSTVHSGGVCSALDGIGNFRLTRCELDQGYV